MISPLKKLRTMILLAPVVAAVMFTSVNPASAAQEPRLLHDLLPGPSGSSPRSYTKIGDQFLTFADSLDGSEPWVLNRTSARQIADIFPGPDSSFGSEPVELNGQIFFEAASAANGSELWRTDGSTVTLVEDINPGPVGSSPDDLTVFKNKVYFAASSADDNVELWRADASGAELVAEINPGADGSRPDSFKVVGNHMYFEAREAGFGYEPFRTDGTTTARLANIHAGASDSYPDDFTEFDGKVYFSATSAAGGNEVWVTDGMVTNQLANIYPGIASSGPRYFTEVGGVLYFTAENGMNGVELWRTTGGAPTMVSDIVPGSEGSDPYDLIAFGNKLYFNADSDAGRELFSSDGVTATLAKDIYPGPEGSQPEELTVVNGVLFMRAESPESGDEPWQVDSSGQVTQVADILPGSSGSVRFMGNVNFTADGDNVIFTANDGTHGFEVWTLAPPVADKKVSIQILGKSAAVGKKGSAAIRLACPADETSGPCKGSFSISTKKKVRFKGKSRKVVIASKKFTIQPGKTNTYKVTVKGPVLNLLRSSKASRSVVVTAKVRDSAGNRKTVKKAYALGRPPG